jgi:hypothetical protein
VHEKRSCLLRLYLSCPHPHHSLPPPSTLAPSFPFPPAHSSSSPSSLPSSTLHLLPTQRRLKMGICAGHPKTILPDHMGRADYHGASVNQSARFMDAGAHGGQVVCELHLAMEVRRGAGALSLTHTLSLSLAHSLFSSRC